MLKRIFAFIVVVTLLLSFAVACGNKGNQTPSAPALKEGVTLSRLIAEIEEEYGVTMPSALDDELLKDLFGVDPGDVVEYAGSISLVNVSADNLVAIKAAEGKTESIQKELESRLDGVRQSFERYLPEQYDKAMAGKVITIGDYVFLIITGRLDEDPVEEVAAVEKKIRESFVNI